MGKRSAGAPAGGPDHPFTYTQGPIAQTGAPWIIENVLDRMNELRFVANQVVIVFALPDGTPFTSGRIDKPRRNRFPRAKNLGEVMARFRTEEGVYMVWHYHPSEQVVVIAVAESQAFRHNRSTPRTTQDALAMIRIQTSLHFLTAELMSPDGFYRCELATGSYDRIEHLSLTGQFREHRGG
jgi:hypothetical protein